MKFDSTEKKNSPSFKNSYFEKMESANRTLQGSYSSVISSNKVIQMKQRTKSFQNGI